MLRLHFLWQKAEKTRINHYGEKAEKKVEIFSIFISAFSPHNWEYWDSAFMAESGEKVDIFFIFILLVSMKAEINMEKKRRLKREKLWTSILFSIRKWRMNVEKSWTSIIFSIGNIERNTGLQMAWSIGEKNSDNSAILTASWNPNNYVIHLISTYSILHTTSKRNHVDLVEFLNSMKKIRVLNSSDARDGIF